MSADGQPEFMLYLIDANVLITAHNRYYPISVIPEFWDWLVFQGEQGHIKIPVENFEEVREGNFDEERDRLFIWLNDETNKAALVLQEEVDQHLVAQVVSAGYAPDLTDQELEQIGRDPFLIAYAMAGRDARSVVTVEVSSPRKIRQNRKVPDVCASLGLICCDTFAMMRALGFSTAWRRP